MIVLSCDSVRERLPELLAGRLSVADADALRGHLAECDACAADRRTIQHLRAARPEAPPALGLRVVEAVSSRRPAPVLLVRRRMLVAATAAAALLGGSMLYRAGRSAAPATAVPDLANGTAAVAVGAAAPALDGQVLMQAPPGNIEADGLGAAASSLDDLSVGELESLLAELKS